jgi:hypothetical protein
MAAGERRSARKKRPACAGLFLDSGGGIGTRDVRCPQPFPRYRAGAGDYYIVNSEAGSYVLIREEAGTNQMAVPYVELAPSAATALIAADRELGVWLWPTITAAAPDRDVIALRTGASGQVRARIVYRPLSGTAERAPYPVYEREQAQLSPSELEQLAPAASSR